MSELKLVEVRSLSRISWTLYEGRNVRGYYDTLEAALIDLGKRYPDRYFKRIKSVIEEGA